MSFRNVRLAAVALFFFVLPVPNAWAHWCHDLWGSSYNIVVRPAADSVSVPAGGSAQLDVYVQNNMGYPLTNFVFTANATGYTISVTRQSAKVAGFLMPGESQRHTLTIRASTSSGTVSVQNVDFLVNFGDGSQNQLYGQGGKKVMVKAKSGALLPPRTVPGLNQGNDQARHLQFSAAADYGNLATSLDSLMSEYCAGRASWDHNGGSANTTYCSGTSTTCPPTISGSSSHTKYDWQHLWAAQELVIRKSSLGTRIAPLRARLQCAWNDGNVGFRYFALMMLGYLGEDATSRTFLTGIINGTGSADDKNVAKAALLLFRSAADKTQYGADVAACLTTANEYVQSACGASLGIVDSNDAAVNSELIPRAGWVEPDLSNENGKSFYAAHLLNLVAWDRRGWAVDANDTGVLSFYGAVAPPVDTTAPKSPVGVACVANANGSVRLNWQQVTQDINNGAETVATYRVYDGAAARPAAAQRPGDNGFDYDHLNTTASIYRDFTGLSGAAPRYFTVTAVDAAGNASTYAQEVSCTPRFPPVAVVSCTPLSGASPLSVTCGSSGSTDPNGVADIATRTFRLDGQNPQNLTEVTYNFAGAGSHVVQLTVIDSTALTHSASATIAVTSTTNKAPLPAATGTPLAGAAPLTVRFSSAGSSDPDVGQTLTYRWDFGDGSTASTQENPSHVFQNAGDYSVTLTVTDSATVPATASLVLAVHATGAGPVDLSSVSASPLSGGAPLDVHFDASGVSAPSGNPVTVLWNFGDSTPESSARVVTHPYSAAGNYTARLTATETNGGSPVSTSFAVIVRAPGQQNQPPDCTTATLTPSSGAAPLRIHLDASGCTDPEGGELSYRWRVPLSYTTEQAFDTAKADFALTSPGTITVKLAVTDHDASPLEVNRTFDVTVSEPSTLAPETISGSLACTSATASGASIFWVLAARLLLPRRRNRKPCL